MKVLSRLPGPFIGFLFISVSIMGCGGSSGGPRKPVLPVEGTISVNKTPADKATITLVPATQEAQKEEWPNGYPSAECDAEGKFKIGTYAKGDGAPAGNYVIIVRWMEGTGEEAKDRLSGKYFNPKTSKNMVEVKAGTAPINLELSK